MDFLAFLAAIGLILFVINLSLRLLFPGRIGQIALGILWRDVVLLLLRACVALVLLPFRLIIHQLPAGPNRYAAFRPQPHRRHRPRHRHRRRTRS